MEFPPQNANPEARVALMEKYGVDMQAVTQTAPVVERFISEGVLSYNAEKVKLLESHGKAGGLPKGNYGSTFHHFLCPDFIPSRRAT